MRDGIQFQSFGTMHGAISRAISDQVNGNASPVSNLHLLERHCERSFRLIGHIAHRFEWEVHLSSELTIKSSMPSSSRGSSDSGNDGGKDEGKKKKPFIMKEGYSKEEIEV